MKVWRQMQYPRASVKKNKTDANSTYGHLDSDPETSVYPLLSVPSSHQPTQENVMLQKNKT